MDIFSFGSPEFRRFSDALERLYQPVELGDFPALVFAVIESLIPGAFQNVHTIDLKTGYEEDHFNQPLSDPEHYRATLPVNLAADHPGIQLITQGVPLPFCRLMDVTTRRRFKQTALYAENFKPMGVNYQLALVLQVPDHFAALAVNRDLDFPHDEEQILRALAPHLNRAHAHSRLYTSLLHSQAKTPEFSARALLKYGITAREAETLPWLIEGKRNGEIAIILGISTRTVEKHVQSLLAKLGCETRTAAAARAQEILFRA